MHVSEPEVPESEDIDSDEDFGDIPLAGPRVNEQASRLGKAVEYLVAASCIIASEGRLNVLTGLVDDEGVDLVFSRFGTSATIAVQVKARRWDRTPLNRGMFQSNVRTQTFRPRADLFVLFVVVEPTGTYEMVWLVPSEDLARMVRPSARGRYVFQAAMSPSTGDRWRPYRLPRKDLATRILSILDRTH